MITLAMTAFRIDPTTLILTNPKFFSIFFDKKNNRLDRIQ
jgi:hypothetical protein